MYEKSKLLYVSEIDDLYLGEVSIQEQVIMVSCCHCIVNYNFSSIMANFEECTHSFFACYDFMKEITYENICRLKFV